MTVLPAWFNRMIWSTCNVEYSRKWLRIVSGEPSRPPEFTFRILRLPFLVFGTKVERPGRRSVAVFAEPTRGIVFQRELEERHTIGASSRFLIRLRTHEIADQGHILIGRQLNDPLAEAGILRPLAGRAEENFGRRAMRILL